MPGFGQSLAYVIDPSILTMSFAAKVAFASPFAKLSVSAASAAAGSATAAMAGRLLRDEQPPSDLGVAEPVLEQPQDLELPPRQLRRRGARRRPRPRRHPPHAGAAHRLSQPVRRRLRAERREDRERLAHRRL